MTAPSPPGQPIEELRYALAEADAHRPPAALRGRVLEAVQLARPAGAHVAAGPAIGPVEAYRRTMESFDSVLAALTDGEWHLHVLRDLDTQGLVGHLIGVERQLHSALGVGPPITFSTDHVASTQADALAQRGRTPAATHEEWRELLAATVSYTATLDRAALARPITLHAFTVSVERMLVVRSFECWTHEEDIRRATG
ncbi:MAG TPA: maleylpyruvate isomerase N-terminal domain-containing protein, partial [Acidimicrobiales bacterium]|nr:maleylpyruvate isomerase N-terminal domain-containing protein [Acidimicrobiales bacterium]